MQTILKGSQLGPPRLAPRLWAGEPPATSAVASSAARSARAPADHRLPPLPRWPLPLPGAGAGGVGGAFGLGLFMALLTVLCLACPRTGRSLRPESLLAPRPGFYSFLEQPG